MIALVLLAAMLAASPAVAAGSEDAFARDTVIITGEVSAGSQNNLSPGRETGIDPFGIGLRLSVLPLPPVGAGVLRGALEIGVQPFYQGYVEPRRAHLGGLKGAIRYHFLSLGTVVPYAELLAGAGGTDFEGREISSTFAFVLEGGIGLSVFLTDRVAVTGGYRFQHVSNGNTSAPNRGFETHMGVLGMSFFLEKGAAGP